MFGDYFGRLFRGLFAVGLLFLFQKAGFPVGPNFRVEWSNFVRLGHRRFYQRKPEARKQDGPTAQPHAAQCSSAKARGNVVLWASCGYV